MKSTTLYRWNPLLLSPAAAEGAVLEKKEPADKKDDKAGDKPDDKKEDELANLSPEELLVEQRKLKDITRGGGRRKEAKKPEEKKEEKKPEEKVEDKKPTEDKKEDKPEAKAAPAKAAAPAPVKKLSVDLPPPIGQDEPETNKSDEPELKTDLKLRPAERRKLQVFQQMEKDGNAPKGFAEDTLKFWEKAAKYQEQWEAAHPGEEFNDQSEDHAAFYKTEPDFDDDDYELSRDNLVQSEARKVFDGEKSAEQKFQKRQQDFQAAQKKIGEDSQNAIMEMIAEASPELAELMGTGDARALTKEITEKMVAKDPVVTEILQETAEELAVLTVELQRLTQFDDVYQPNLSKSLTLKVSGRNIYPHAQLLNFMQGLEAEMLTMPAESTARGKQRLVSNASFNKEYSRIAGDKTLDGKAKREAIADLNSKYYTLTEDDFRRGLVAQYAAIAKADIKKFSKRAGLRTPKKEEAAAKTPPEGEKKDEKAAEEKPTEEQEEEVSPVQRTRSPSSASASDAVDPGAKPGKTDTTEAKSAVARSRGR